MKLSISLALAMAIVSAYAAPVMVSLLSDALNI